MATTYKVKPGDALSIIAKNYNTSVADIAKANGITNTDLIYAGQVLDIPDSNASTSSGNTSTVLETTKPPKPVFNNSTYTPSDTVNKANADLEALLAQKPGAYQSQWMTQLTDIINKIQNREPFSYDLNGDALYQQYKDKYIKQGKMAMGDAIGQASAMTGGYGNSYAQSVGQQQYQASLDNLNDIVPELWQMAYDRYNQEGQDLYNQFAMFGEMENLDYGRYRDTVTDWQTNRGYYTDVLNNERAFDFDVWQDGIDRENSLAQKQYENQYGEYIDDRDMAYQKERDKVEDEQWEKQYDAVYGNKNTGSNSTTTIDHSGGATGNASPTTTSKAPTTTKPTTTTPTGFTGSTYSEAVTYAKKNGVPAGAASGIMDQATWYRKKNSGSTTAEVKNYKTYQEYLKDITAYLIEKY